MIHLRAEKGGNNRKKRTCRTPEPSFLLCGLTAGFAMQSLVSYTPPFNDNY